MVVKNPLFLVLPKIFPFQLSECLTSNFTLQNDHVFKTIFQLYIAQYNSNKYTQQVYCICLLCHILLISPNKRQNHFNDLGI